MIRTILPVICLVSAAALSLPAQQTKVVPAGMGQVEGPLVFTYPFGRDDGAIQILYDADQVTLGVGAITGIGFRPSQQTQSATGYTKNYRVTAYVVQTPASAMVADPATNIGGAVGTVVFNGPLTLPSIGPLATAPGPFNIRIPFQSPFPYDGSTGNLLLLVETTDLTPTNSGTYRIDAVNLRNDRVEGIVSDIDGMNCINGTGNSLALAGNDATAVEGGSIDLTLASTSTGAFPTALVFLGLSRQQTNLGSVGLPSCTAYLAPFVWTIASENPGGGYPMVSWSLPSTPPLEGAAVFTQALGLANPSLQDAVASNALAIRIGDGTIPPQKAMSAFRTSSGWFIGRNGTFVPVVQLEGAFP